MVLSVRFANLFDIKVGLILSAYTKIGNYAIWNAFYGSNCRFEKYLHTTRHNPVGET